MSVATDVTILTSAIVGAFGLGIAAGYTLRLMTAPCLRTVPNPAPSQAADTHYWVIEDSGGKLAFTDEQVEVASQRAVRLGI